MGGLKTRPDRSCLDDRRVDPPAVWRVGDGVDGPPLMFTPPASLGPFKFPSPYNTDAIRLTNASNAPHGCQPRAYSYHSLVNNHAGRPFLYVFLGRIGTTPMILKVNKATGDVSTYIELPWISTGENCYWSDTDPDRLYWLSGNRLSYLRVTEDGFGSVEVFSLDARYGNDLWQAHSSSNDQVHSATARRVTNEGSYPKLGTVVYRKGQQHFFKAEGVLDESQIDKSGRWLVIQENDDNRILDLETGMSRLIGNRDGAVAHADCGAGLVVGEDDMHEAGALVSWDLTDPHSQRHLVHATGGASLGHVAIRGGRALLSSNATNELIDVSLADGSSRPIAPGMIDGHDYDHQLRACLDPTGQYGCWIAEVEGRFDAFLVRVGDGGPIIVTPDPGGTTVAVLDTIKHLRKNYPTPMSNDQLGQLLNAVAWTHRAEGYGLLKKPNGANCPQPVTGTLISRDILMLKPDGRIFDCLIDAEGKATPTWGEKHALNPKLFVAAIDPESDLPHVPEEPGGPPMPGTKPFRDEYAVEFGQAVNRLYEGSGRDVDPGMIAVQSARAAFDYYVGGMSWPASRDKHVAEFKQAAGL